MTRHRRRLRRDQPVVISAIPLGGRSAMLAGIAVLVAYLSAACVVPAPAASPTAPSKAAPATTIARPPAVAAIPTAVSQAATAAAGGKFQDLVARAKTSNGHLKGSVGIYTPEEVRAWEDAFGKRFGIKLQLENEPGHPSNDILPKMLQAYKSGQPLVDWTGNGAPELVEPLMQGGALRIPPWDALKEEWPLVEELRTKQVNLPGGPNGTGLQDYCLVSSQLIWTLIYNTQKVSASEIKGITWDDLLTDKWKGRVAIDALAGGISLLPFHGDWSPDRLKAYSQNLGANGLKMVPGGSPPIMQLVIQGEADVGLVSGDLAFTQMSLGAPIGLTWPEVVPFNQLSSCLPKLTPNNQDLGALFWAWRATEGEWLRAERGSGGVRPLVAAEAAKYPIGKLVAEAGVSDKRLAAPTTPEQFAQVKTYRDLSVAAMTAGVQTGTKVPYSWSCARQHPSCVR